MHASPSALAFHTSSSTIQCNKKLNLITIYCITHMSRDFSELWIQGGISNVRVGIIYFAIKYLNNQQLRLSNIYNQKIILKLNNFANFQEKFTKIL